jgi:GGDEF domain-containing protein
MEINGNTPKEIHYINKLRTHFSQTWTRRLKKKLRPEKDRYSKSELAEILDSKNSDYAYQFLEKLIDENVLKEAGERETASNNVSVYTYNGNKALLKAFQSTDFYQENRELLVRTLEKAEGKELL